MCKVDFFSDGLGRASSAVLVPSRALYKKRKDFGIEMKPSVCRRPLWMMKLPSLCRILYEVITLDYMKIMKWFTENNMISRVKCGEMGIYFHIIPNVSIQYQVR